MDDYTLRSPVLIDCIALGSTLCCKPGPTLGHSIQGRLHECDFRTLPVWALH